MTGQHTSPEAASRAAKQQSAIVSLVRSLDTGEILFSYAVSQEDGVTSTVASMPYLKGTTGRSMKAVSQQNSVSKSISRQAFAGLGLFFSARLGWAVLAGVGLEARGGVAQSTGAIYMLPQPAFHNHFTMHRSKQSCISMFSQRFCISKYNWPLQQNLCIYIFFEALCTIKRPPELGA